MKSLSLNFLLVSLIIIWSVIQVSGQEKVFQTFKDTRVINSHSTETLPGGKMDIRIGHRFGDIGGAGGGWPSFYGLENASDVMIGLEYGMSDNVMIGINRAKGSGPLRQNVNFLTKMKIISQEVNGSKPFSLSFLAMGTASTMPKSTTEGVLSYFDKSAHRFSYHLQLIAGKKFSDYFSWQLSAGWTYRNLVPSNDKNDLVSVGSAMRIQMTKSMGIILDATVPISELRTTSNGYYPALGIGLEWDTGGGHIFQLNFTNATGLSETDYIPYTQSNWLDGEFRMGFTISRLFTI